MSADKEGDAVTSVLPSMRNIQFYDVSPSLPHELRFLEILACNLWWCWNYDAIELMRRIDPRLWKACSHNPQLLLSRLPQDRFEALVEDEAFMGHYDQVIDRFERELKGRMDAQPPRPPQDCIAYFSLEYGIHESVRLYSGGLGCLAGDHLKSASDLNLPLAAVGLMYRCGYFQQYLDDDGWQQEACRENEISHLPLTKACDAKGRQVAVEIPLPDGVLRAVTWTLQVGTVPLYLLDANIPENPPHYRQVTSALYESDREIRIRQELLLGLGGFRALTALGYEPAVCHMNEGHAAFQTLGRLSYLIAERGMDFQTAEEIVRRTSVFTTHTPVPAGNETFALDLVQGHLAVLEESLGFPVDTVVGWGQPPNGEGQDRLSMTILGLRTACYSNGVSRLHGRVARDMWAHLWPSRPVDELPIRHVTNGIHVTSWVSSGNASLFDLYLGPEWRQNPSSEETLSRIDDIPDDDLWRAHELGRARLVRSARERGQQQYEARNATRTDLDRIKSVLHHDVLTIGFARRFAAYKRGALLLHDPERFEALLTNPERPVQMIIAGKAHPADETGKNLIRQIIHFARRDNVRSRIIFLEDYDIQIARYLVQGVDVWLNTPRRPHEASGTSGMKAAVNGALHVSTLDGWWDEGYTPEAGWAIGHGETYDNTEYQDAVESQALYNLLEDEVIPKFYDRASGDVPHDWVAMMKASIRMALGTYNSHRMVSEYNDLFYQPACAAYAELAGEDRGRVLALVEQRKRLTELWKTVRLHKPVTDTPLSSLHVGDRFTVEAVVELGELRPEEVDVQVYYGPVSAENRIHESHAEAMSLQEQRGDGAAVYTNEVTCATSGRYGFTVRVVPKGDTWSALIPGFMTWAEGA